MKIKTRFEVKQMSAHCQCLPSYDHKVWLAGQLQSIFLTNFFYSISLIIIHCFGSLLPTSTLLGVALVSTDFMFLQEE